MHLTLYATSCYCMLYLKFRYELNTVSTSVIVDIRYSDCIHFDVRDLAYIITSYIILL